TKVSSTTSPTSTAHCRASCRDAARGGWRRGERCHGIPRDRVSALGQDLNGTDEGAGGRPATEYDASNCTGGNCERRAQYLRSVTDLLVDDLTWMVGQRQTDGAARKALPAGLYGSGWGRRSARNLQKMGIGGPALVFMPCIYCRTPGSKVED